AADQGLNQFLVLDRAVSEIGLAAGQITARLRPQRAGNLVSIEERVGNLTLLRPGLELVESDLGIARRKARVLIDRERRHDDGEPEEDTLKRRVHLCFRSSKSSMPSPGDRMRHLSASATPATHIISPLTSVTIGTASRSRRGTLRSTSTSCNLRRPGAPRG